MGDGMKKPVDETAPTRTIDGIVFHSSPIEGRPAFALQRQLMAMIGGAIRQGMATGVQSFDGALLASLGSLATQLSEEEWFALADRVLFRTAAVINGKMVEIKNEEAFNKVFTRRTSLVYKAMAFAIEVSFPDFFEKMPGWVGVFVRAAKARIESFSKVSPTASPSNGPAGESSMGDSPAA